MAPSHYEDLKGTYLDRAMSRINDLKAKRAASPSGRQPMDEVTLAPVTHAGPSVHGRLPGPASMFEPDGETPVARHGDIGTRAAPARSRGPMDSVEISEVPFAPPAVRGRADVFGPEGAASPETATSPPAYPAGSLHKGVQNDNVHHLQSFLGGTGHSTGDSTGDFDDKTEKAVRAFQKSRGLKVDGIVGGDTRDTIRGIVQHGNSLVRGMSGDEADDAASV